VPVVPYVAAVGWQQKLVERLETGVDELVLEIGICGEGYTPTRCYSRFLDMTASTSSISTLRRLNAPIPVVAWTPHAAFQRQSFAGQRSAPELKLLPRRCRGLTARTRGC